MVPVSYTHLDVYKRQDLEDVEYQLSKAKLLGCKGTTGTQASFLELFEGDQDVYKRQLLGRCRNGVVPLPGGCNFGVRPIDQHLKGFGACLLYTSRCV